MKLTLSVVLCFTLYIFLMVSEVMYKGNMKFFSVITTYL